MRTLLKEYEDVLNEDMPFAGVGREIMNTARLLGREVERNAANIVGQTKKVGRAAVDTINPLMSVEGMKNNVDQMNLKIQKDLAAVDERYPDVIEALWRTAQLTDFQAFLFMLNPALYLGTKTIPQTLSFTVDALSNIAGVRGNPVSSGLQTVAHAANRLTNAAGPGSNQDASSGGGSGGYGDYGGDMGGGDY